MKQVFFNLLLVISTIAAIAQNKVLSSENVTNMMDSRWDIHKYVWSRACNNTGKNNKPAIDFNAIDSWPGLGHYLSVSHDGKYFAYTIVKGSGLVSFNKTSDSLIVQSTSNSLRLSFTGTKPGFFSNDSKKYIYDSSRTLCFLSLEKGQYHNVKDVISYKLPDNGRNEWLAYQLKSVGSDVILQNLVTGEEKRFNRVSTYNFSSNSEWFACQINSNSHGSEPNELLLYNLITGIEKRFPFVTSYFFGKTENVLLLKTIEKGDKGVLTSLRYVMLPQGNAKTVWSTTENEVLSSYSLDDSCKQIVFTVQDSSGLTQNILPNYSIWYYRDGMDKAILKLTSKTTGIIAGFSVGGTASFTNNGRYIQFTLLPKTSSQKTDPTAVQLDVWSYSDFVLQSTQSHFLSEPKSYVAIIGAEDNRVIPLESEGKELYLLQGDFAIVKKRSCVTHGDRFWEKGYGYNEDSNWLVSLKDGSKHLLATRGGYDQLWFSPGGNYLVYFDVERGCHYFSYDLHNGTLRNISSNVPANRLGNTDARLRNDEPGGPLGLAAWLQNDTGLLVYDRTDIWQLDLTGKKTAVNVTNDIGRENGVIFSLMNSQRGTARAPIIVGEGTLLLRAFNKINKHNGYYYKMLGASAKPELLQMGPYFIDIIPFCHDLDLSNTGMQPVKARDVNIWIVQRQSATESPNYFKTTDFKSFKQLTDFQPHKDYNWLTEELHSFKQLDGFEGHGILYKPENFDSTKKYPVIIVFYGTYSNTMYQFREPGYNYNAITPGVSPIWFLNNGYLVFTPDIYISPLKYGPEAYNVIEGAVQYLKRLDFVDTQKLGCCSHSWSAKLGSYLFTHSSSFAAVAISEGFLYSNMINIAFSSDEDGKSQLETVEEGFQFGSLWKNKDLWLDQTTVLNVDKVRSPLLLLCNKHSSNEYQNQTLQLFTALRRLEKKVWWLQYDKGGHNLLDLNEEKDYSIRYTQFFDHYLKEAPAPKWMTQGLPAKLKGIEARYELDAAGSCAMKGKTTCNICDAWNRQYKRTPEMFDKPISEWKLDADIQLALEKAEKKRHDDNMKGEAQRIKENNEKLKGVWKGEPY
jgi:dipeptidyl aminopeptidase/acylaminoacyl peptidase